MENEYLAFIQSVWFIFQLHIFKNQDLSVKQMPNQTINKSLQTGSFGENIIYGYYNAYSLADNKEKHLLLHKRFDNLLWGGQNEDWSWYVFSHLLWDES